RYAGRTREVSRKHSKVVSLGYTVPARTKLSAWVHGTIVSRTMSNISASPWTWLSTKAVRPLRTPIGGPHRPAESNGFIDRVTGCGHRGSGVTMVADESWSDVLEEEDEDWSSFSTTRTGSRIVGLRGSKRSSAQPTERCRQPSFSIGRSLVYLGSLLGLLCAIGGIAVATFLLAGAGQGAPPDVAFDIVDENERHLELDANAQARISSDIDQQLQADAFTIDALMTDSLPVISPERWTFQRNERWFEDTLPDLGKFHFKQVFRISPATFIFQVESFLQILALQICDWALYDSVVELPDFVSHDVVINSVGSLADDEEDVPSALEMRRYVHGRQDDVASSASPAIPVVTTNADRERGRAHRAIVFWGQTSRTLTQASATFREALGGSHDKASRLNGYAGQPLIEGWQSAYERGSRCLLCQIKGGAVFGSVPFKECSHVILGDQVFDLAHRIIRPARA
ncbi:hypothetical protein HPB47_006409, partial [Ixodes persulcatus]